MRTKEVAVVVASIFIVGAGCGFLNRDYETACLNGRDCFANESCCANVCRRVGTCEGDAGLDAGTDAGATAVDAAGYAVPVITSVSPPTGPTDGGIVVAISGSGFAVPDASVRLGASQLSIVAIGDGGTSLSVIAPSGKMLAAVDVSVSTAGGTHALLGAYRFLPTITTYAGGGPIDGRSVWSIPVKGHHLAIDPQGRIVTSLSDENQIVRIEPEGTLTVLAGTGKSESAPDGPAQTTPLNAPRALAFNDAGELHFAEEYANRVRKLADGGLVTVAGTGAAASTGDNGPATSAALFAPFGVAFDSDGRLLITERRGHRVRRVDTDSGIITTVAGTGDAGSGVDGPSALATDINAPMEIVEHPSGSNGFAFSEYGSNIVRSVTALGNTKVIIGGGAATFDAGLLATSIALTQPYCLARIPGGDLVVSLWSGRVFRFAATSETVEPIAGTGTNAVSYGGVPAISGGVYNPCATATSTGSILFTGYGSGISRAVHAIDSAGNFQVIAGSGTNYFGDNGPASKAGLYTPSGLAFHAPSQSLFIADFNNSRIRRVDADGSITTAAGTGAFGYGSDLDPIESAPLNVPWGLAFDGAGDLIFSEYSNRRIRGLFFGAGFVGLIAGTGATGYSGEGGLATSAALNRPTGLALSASGDIYFADRDNHVIRRVRGTDGVIDRVAGTPGATWLDAGSIGDGNFATSATLAYPTGVAFDSASNMFIADRSHFRVRRVRAADGIIETIAGTGDSGATPEDGLTALSTNLRWPGGLCVNGDSEVFVGDNDSVRRLSRDDAGTWIARIVAGAPGDAGYSGDDGPAPGAQVGGILAVECVPGGTLFVAGSAHNVVRMIR